MMELKSLECFGIKHAWQVPLICPVEIEDYTNIVTEFSKAYQLSGHKSTVPNLSTILTFYKLIRKAYEWLIN